jgi:2-polyprenyl-3-methyl-5-hydroxy-6-metoxy-1,4-benzoquinol methylase/Zn ribbon nucleic-acid-binding protein
MLTACPVCGATERRPFCTSNGYAIVECLACTHAFVDAMPSDEELATLYRDTSESFHGSGLAGPLAAYLGVDDRRYFAFYDDRLRAIEASGLAMDARILDFGCAQGAFVATLAKKGFSRVTGFDASAEAVAEGRDRWGLDLHTGSFKDFVAARGDTFDLVHAANVLEHVRDPREVLAEFRRLVGAGGKLVLSVPNARSLQVRIARTRSPVIAPPHHLQYYGPKSLSRLVTEAGFHVVRVETDFWQPASDLYLNMKGVPLWVGRVIRRCMGVPGVAINALRLGGVVSVLAA